MQVAPWYTGRTFYTCRLCSAEHEHHTRDGAAPETVRCWNCPADMVQVPPSVKRDRDCVT